MIGNWKLLLLLLIGRVNIIKLVVLRKCTYLFQNMPIFIISSFFMTLDSIIIPFIWAYKHPHISKACLRKHIKEGGLGLPVFRHYFWARNTRAWVFCNQSSAGYGDEHRLYPRWPETESCYAVSLTIYFLNLILKAN